MIELSGRNLKVSVLDPVADRGRLGSRYCTGGYLWQVEDAQRGPLFTGPCAPDRVTAFDGQGAPEVFEIALGADRAPVGGTVGVIGVGVVRRESPVRPFHVRDNSTVGRFVDWTIETDASFCRMQTRQVFAEYALELTRLVTVQGRAVESRTVIRNRANPSLPVRWFAHPFFPWTDPLCRFSLECSVPPNPGFALGDDGFLVRRAECDWQVGCFQPLQLCFGYPLQVEQKHPAVGTVEVTCGFPMAWLPVWGNARTFSFEPYFHTVLENGGSADWFIRYRF